MFALFCFTIVFPASCSAGAVLHCSVSCWLDCVCGWDQNVCQTVSVACCAGGGGGQAYHSFIA